MVGTLPWHPPRLVLETRNSHLRWIRFRGPVTLVNMVEAAQDRSDHDSSLTRLWGAKVNLHGLVGLLPPHRLELDGLCAPHT